MRRRQAFASSSEARRNPRKAAPARPTRRAREHVLVRPAHQRAPPPRQRRRRHAAAPRLVVRPDVWRGQDERQRCTRREPGESSAANSSGGVEARGDGDLEGSRVTCRSTARSSADVRTTLSTGPGSRRPSPTKSRRSLSSTRPEPGVEHPTRRSSSSRSSAATRSRTRAPRGPQPHGGEEQASYGPPRAPACGRIVEHPSRLRPCR